jgi:hypothetical protein
LEVSGKGRSSLEKSVIGKGYSNIFDDRKMAPFENIDYSGFSQEVIKGGAFPV